MDCRVEEARTLAAAVDDEVGARDVRSMWRGQEQAGVGDVVRSGKASEWHGIGHLLDRRSVAAARPRSTLGLD